MTILLNLQTTNHRKSGESKYDRKPCELDVAVTKRIRYGVKEVEVSKNSVMKNDTLLKCRHDLASCYVYVISVSFQSFAQGNCFLIMLIKSV